MEELCISAVKDLLLLANHADVVHHIPGRIRVRVRPSALQAMRGRDVRSLIDCIPGLLNVRVNLAVGSVVIEYDRKMLSYELWEKIGQLRKRPDLATEIEERVKSLWTRGATL